MKSHQCFYGFLLVLTLVLLQFIEYSSGDLDWKWCDNFEKFSNTSIEFFDVNLNNRAKYSPIEDVLGEKFLINMKNRNINSCNSEEVAEFLKNEFELYSNLTRQNITFERLMEGFSTAKDYSGFHNYMNNWNELMSKYYISNLFKGSVDKASNFLKRFMGTLKEIPGPLWCEAENIYDENDEIGIFKKSFNCCQEHDKCSLKIPACSSFMEFKNRGLFTKFACHCEREFYECLKNANNTISKKIGFTYFTVISPQCVGYGNPISNCDRSKHVWRTKCLADYCPHHFDKKFGWFDTPDF